MANVSQFFEIPFAFGTILLPAFNRSARNFLIERYYVRSIVSDMTYAIRS